MGVQKLEKIESNVKNLGITSLKGEHQPLEPKFIRGPTAYKPVKLKKTKSHNKGSNETVKGIALKPRQGKESSAKFIESEEFNDAEMELGELPDKRRVLLTARKNDDTSFVNTYKEKKVDLARAKPLFKRDLTTYSENMDECFCHLIGSDVTADHFLRYLERAAHATETEALTTVFPFLDQSGHVKTLHRLMRQKSELQSDFKNAEEASASELIQEINAEMDEMRSKIYDDHLKKVQFKTRIEKVLKEAPEMNDTSENEEEFWLWVWLRKLLNTVVENIKETQAIIEASLEEPVKPQDNSRLTRD